MTAHSTDRNPWWHPTHRILGALFLGCVLTACTDNPAGPSDPQDNDLTFTGSVPAFGFNQHAFTTGRAGELEAQLTWPDKNKNLDLHLTRGDCNVYPVGGGCPILVSSRATTGSTERITHTVASGEQLKVWVDSSNFGDAAYTIEVTIE